MSGQTWLEHGEVLDLLGITSKTLAHWVRRGCIALGGRRIRTRNSRNGQGRKRRLYCEADIREVERVLGEPIGIVADAAGRWVPINMAAVMYQVARNTLRTWHKQGDPLSGLPLRGRKELRLTGRGVRTVLYLSMDDLEAIAAARAGHSHKVHYSGEVRVKVAADMLGVEKESVNRWCREGCPYKGGEKMASTLRPMSRGSRRKVRWIAIAEVEAILAEKARQQAAATERRNGTAFHRDEEGFWLTGQQAAKRIGWAVSTVHKQRRGCAWLGGRPIRWKWCNAPMPGKAYRRVAVYHQDDVSCIAQRRGNSGVAHRDTEGTWLFAREAASRIGCQADTMKRYGGVYCPALGRAMRRKLVPGSMDGPPRNRLWAYLEADVAEVERVKSNGQKPPTLTGNGQAGTSTPAADAVDQAGAPPATPAAIDAVPVEPTAAVDAIDQAAGVVAAEPEAPAAEGNGRRRGRPREWDDLRAMICELDGIRDKDIAKQYNQRYGRAIGEGHRKRATSRVVKDQRRALRTSR